MSNILENNKVGGTQAKSFIFYLFDTGQGSDFNSANSLSKNGNKILK
jgi:hypothetical protein